MRAGAMKLLTTPQAEDALALASGSLRVDRCTGRLGVPFVRIGRAVRYRERDLEAWVAARVMVPVGGKAKAETGKART